MSETENTFRPMGIGDILDVTFRLYRRHFATVMLIALTAYVPYALLMAGVQAGSGPQQQGTATPTVNFQAGQDAGGGQAQPQGQGQTQSQEFEFEYQAGGSVSTSSNQNLVAGIGTLLFFLVVMPLCQGAMVRNISAAYLGETLGAADSYRLAAPRLLRLLIANLFVIIIVTFGLFLLVVPGIIFSLWFLLTSTVVMLENVSATRALGRSKELMSGNLGKGFLLAALIWVLGVVFAFLVGMVTAVVPWPHPSVAAFVQNVVQALILPIQVIPVILLYYDLRIRKEAFDLEQLADSLSSADTGQAQPAT